MLLVGCCHCDCGCGQSSKAFADSLEYYKRWTRGMEEIILHQDSVIEQMEFEWGELAGRLSKYEDP